MNVDAYVDGSFYPDRGVYGWGLVLLNSDTKETIKQESGGGDSDSLVQYRNVAGECLAALRAAAYMLVEDNHIDKLTIYHDYIGISKWVDGSWRANNILSRSYRQKMQEIMQEHDIQFVKVTGHSGNAFNNWADSLAKEGAEQYVRNLEALYLQHRS